MIKKLAKITKANLETQENGVLTFWIYVDYEEGLSQGVGGIVLDEYNKEQGRRVGTAFGCELIRSILFELKVNDFSEMKNQKVWVYHNDDSFNSIAKGISSLKVDNPESNPIIFDDVKTLFEIDVKLKKRDN